MHPKHQYLFNIHLALTNDQNTKLQTMGYCCCCDGKLKYRLKMKEYF